MFEILAYVAAYYCYRWLRDRYGDPVPLDRRWSVIAAAAIGALVGSRLLAVVNEAQHSPAFGWHALVSNGGGKTVVGGLFGAWLAVELVKRVTGIHVRTGDLFAVPLCVGIAIGRIGCFWAGLRDDTYGNPTNLPWGVDFGDGIRRHPTQLYEILFVLALGAYLWRSMGKPHMNGAIFRQLIAAYLTFRLVVDFLKPGTLLAGLTAIQWACCGGLLILIADISRNFRPGKCSQSEEARDATKAR